MSNLAKGTALADSVRDECSCVRNCDDADCPGRGGWHTHADDACAVHPEVLVDARR
ncbi:MAG: hypothetical protein ABWX84_09695 [Nocardioides sp.]